MTSYIISKLNSYDIQNRSNLKFQIHPKLHTSFWEQFHYNRKTSPMTYTEKIYHNEENSIILLIFLIYFDMSDEGCFFPFIIHYSVRFMGPIV